MKRVFSALLVMMIAVSIGACSGKKKGADVTSTDVAASQTPFEELVSIFKGFEDIVAANREDPKAGIKACQKYSENNIKKIKTLEKGLKKDETDPEYLKQMVDADRQIKEISDRITKIVTESYGIDGADILMQLSDMSLARL